MTQTVNIAEPEAVLLTKLREPEVRCVVVHRQPVPFHEEPVRFYPFITEILLVSVLFSLELPEQTHYYQRELQRALGLLRLCGVSIDAARLASVIRGALDADNIVIPANVLPFETEYFSAAESIVHSKNNEDLELQGLVFECRKYFLDFFNRVYLFFLLNAP